MPPVNDILDQPAIQSLVEEWGRPVVLNWTRQALESLREQMAVDGSPPERLRLIAAAVQQVSEAAAEDSAIRFGKVINATGVVLHTSLGRAPLADSAVQAIASAARACNLEVDLGSGDRRERGHQLDLAWRELSGAEAALVVNNNAAATLLALRALCTGREVLISRGQLVEIGGSFRLPDVFAESGAILREVGTTNRTRLADYAEAIGPNTAAILRVHPSNYRIVGFTEAPDISELSRLARAHGLLSLDDIGSGCLIDTTRLGLPREPSFQESLSAGADLVLGSGDKLLGGPQCGILLGSGPLIDQLRRHPLARAMRIDKLTFAALSATLDCYRRGRALEEVPTLTMLATSAGELRLRAERLLARVSRLRATIRNDVSLVGGGSIPGAELPTVVLELEHPQYGPDELARQLRLGRPRVFAAIRRGAVCLDLRSVCPDEDRLLAELL